MLTPLDGDGHEVLQGPAGVVPETMRPPKRLQCDIVLVTLCHVKCRVLGLEFMIRIDFQTYFLI